MQHSAKTATHASVNGTLQKWKYRLRTYIQRSKTNFLRVAIVIAVLAGGYWAHQKGMLRAVSSTFSGDVCKGGRLYEKNAQGALVLKRDERRRPIACKQ